MNDMIEITPNFTAIKIKQYAAWASGDYARVGTTFQIVGEMLAEAMNLVPGARVLDVAAGNGNATLAFARRWCDVTSTDYVEALLERGRIRADAEALPVTFKVADAEALPFSVGSFDAVVSTFGVMFAPDQRQAAAEMLRVCRSGGKIGMANWTPDSFIGAVFRVLGQFIRPPAGVNSPALWGDREWLESIFQGHKTVVRRQAFNFRYRSPEHFVEFFAGYYGPVHKAFLTLDAAGRERLKSELLELIDDFNTENDGTMRVPSMYVEVVVTKA